MDFDFATIMVLAALITGLIWAADALFWAPKRRLAVARLKASAGAPVDEERIEEAGKEPVLVEYARSFFPVIVIVLILRSFLIEPFRIPSGSMIPTLHVGDFILVNKYAYGLRLPVSHNKFLSIGEPERGDVVVFRYPKDPSTDYIKRVVGIPGDHITYVDKRLYINGQKVDLEHIGPYVSDNTGLPMPGSNVFRETLGDVKHKILVESAKRPFDGVDLTVPPGRYFVMGDNRDNSNDSRYWGTVPEANLVGRAFFIWMNFSDLDRVGTTIH